MPIVLGALVVVSCATGPPEGSELEFAYPPGPLTLDPARCTTELDRILCSLLYSGLVHLLDDGTLEPELALPPERPPGMDRRAWRQGSLLSQCSSPNGLVFTFRIHPDAHFGNGREVFVQDVRYSFERLMDPATGATNDAGVDRILGALDFAAARRDESALRLPDPVVAETIRGIEEIDAKTFRLRLTEPYVPFLYNLTAPEARILPATETAEAVDSATGPFALAALGSGPWQIVAEESDPERQIVLRAKPGHWSGDRIQTHRLKFRIVEDPAQAERLFDDEILALLVPPVEERSKWMNDPKYQDQIVSATRPATSLLAFNFRKPLLRDLDRRRAIARALDIPRLVDVFGRDRAVQARGLLPEVLLRAGLAQALEEGVEAPRSAPSSFDWPPLSLVTPDESSLQRVADQIRRDLSRIGLSAVLKPLDESGYERALQNGEFDLALATVSAGHPVPGALLASFSLTETHAGGLNFSHYANPYFDFMITEACTVLDDAQRGDLYRQADDLLGRDYAAVFLWHDLDVEVRQIWLSGYRHSLMPTVAAWNTMFRETDETRYERPGAEPAQAGSEVAREPQELSVRKAAALGVVQGLTEFLPISSSGHLKIAQRLFELEGGSQYLFFDCLLHMGTLFAVLFFYRREIPFLLKGLAASPGALLARARKRTPFPDSVVFLLFLAVGTFVTVMFALIFRQALEILFDSMAAVGFALIVTGCLLLATRAYQKPEEIALTFKHAALIGLAQGLAITPGLSRSGTTIAVALLLGLPRETSVRFSFLLSVPVIVGATLLQTTVAERMVAWGPAAVGTAVSLLSGICFLWMLVRIVEGGRFFLFGFYTIPVGVFVFLFLSG